ncbi:unnamed protein product [Staurois parvus]|uniref:Uncharacterized protein n=1 Tax=Staurois parvus TaxID=386267 RepID=A0ABN9EJ64_9NEOB|nr:unnamed protein product [Staurois parvus]
MGAVQGQTGNSWGPRAIGDHGAPVSLPKLKKAYEKGTRGISWGPLLTPGPWAVPEFPNGQSAPAQSRNSGAIFPFILSYLKHTDL